MRVLVAAAWEPELTHLRARLAAAPKPGLEVELATLGVGAVESALAMTRCVARHSPEVALLIGTAGALPVDPALAVGAVVVASEARIVDAALLDGRAELPPPMPARVALDPVLHGVLTAAGARSVAIANTIGITVDDALAGTLAAGGDHVEHLEAFGFARACEAAGVRAAIVLGIANAVGSRGRAEWLANHVRASALAADQVLAALEAIRTTTTAPSPGRG
jgi:futalosine hydrolase